MSLKLTKADWDSLAKQGILKKPKEQAKNKLNSTTMEIIRLAKEGMSGTEISKVMNRERSMACRYLREHGKRVYLTWDEIEWLEKKRNTASL